MNHYFYPTGPVVDDPATPNVQERSAGFETDPLRFSGNWLNWWTTRRFDVAKKVLTGGRLAEDPNDYVLLGMSTDRDNRRIFNDVDKASLVTQSFYGVKDRTLFDGNPAQGKGPNDFMDVTDVEVTYGDPSTVSGSTVVMGGSSWDQMLASMQSDEITPSYGWVLDLVDIAGANSGERVLEKPSILGGLVMFSTFKPNTDICQYGGDGRLYGLYYETGTAYKRDVFSFGEPAAGNELERSLDLGQGRSSGIAIHLGQQKGGKLYEQQSTGTVREILLKTPFRTKSGSVIWYER